MYGAGEDGRTVPVPGDRTLTLITLIEVGTAAIAELLHSDGVLSGVRVWCIRVCFGKCSRVIFVCVYVWCGDCRFHCCGWSVVLS